MLMTQVVVKSTYGRCRAGALGSPFVQNTRAMRGQYYTMQKKPQYGQRGSELALRPLRKQCGNV